LLLEIETSGIGHEHNIQKDTRKTEPGNNVEFGLGGDIVVEDGGGQSTEFAASGGKPVSSSTNGNWINLGGCDECNTVGTELVEEGGQEVHGLKGVDALDGFVVVVVERRDDEEDEVGGVIFDHPPRA